MPDLDVSRLMGVSEAIEIIDSVPVTPCIEQLGIWEAHGYTLAEEVVADRDYPPFDKSLMDGFAVGGPDSEAKIVGEVAAGGHAERAIGPGEAMAIMTGAPVPAGTFGVAPVEYTEAAGTTLRIRGAVTAGQNISRRGADVPAGYTVLHKGQRLESPQLAVAASVGKTRLSIFSRPRAGVLSTGDEIVSYDQSPSPTQIRNSNSIMLLSLLRRMDCQAVDLGHVRDDRELITQQILRGLDSCDTLFITGGMSMGKYDYVPQILAELRVKPLITKLRIKPGKPFVFGVKDDSRFVFGLPGNPVSGFVCMIRLASRLIRRMQGRSPEPAWIQTTLLADLPANGNREFYQPVRFAPGGVMPLAWKGSADIFTLAQADGLLSRPENDAALLSGYGVQVMAIT